MPSTARGSSRPSGAGANRTAAVPVDHGVVPCPLINFYAGAQYYQYDAKEAWRLLADAGFPKGFHTQLTASPGHGRDLVDDAQLRSAISKTSVLRRR